MDHGQVFKGSITNAYQNYDEQFKPTTASLYIKVEYLLETHLKAIEIPKRQVPPQQSATPHSFFTKVAGVSHEGRQHIVARCSIGEALKLVREPNNRFDAGAIQVLRSNGEQLGFVPAHVSRNGDSSGLAARMDRGDQYRCRISSLTGGNGNTLGVNIEIVEGKGFSNDVLSNVPTIEPSMLLPVDNNVGWLFAIAAMVALIITFILFVQK